jgi:hypothetical protein
MRQLHEPDCILEEGLRLDSKKTAIRPHPMTVEHTQMPLKAVTCRLFTQVAICARKK